MTNFLKKNTKKHKNIWMIYKKRFNKENKGKTSMKNSTRLKAIPTIIKIWKITIHFAKKERVNLKN